MALFKSCSRCGTLIPYPKTYCTTCAPLAAAEREQFFVKRRAQQTKTYNQNRNPRYTRFYASSDWKRLRQSKMQDARYSCEACKGLATEVHHIQPIQTPEGWEKRLEWNNLKALCTDCHNAAHGRFKKRKNKR